MSDAPRKPLPPRASGPNLSSSEPSGPAYYKTKEVPAYRGGTPESALVGEVMHHIETMNQDLLKNVDARLQKHAASSAEAHETTRRHVLQLTHIMKVLWRSVKGSEPPPPPTNGELAYSMTEGSGSPFEPSKAFPGGKLPGEQEPLDEKISLHDESIAGVQGQIIALQVGQAELLKLQKEQMGKHEEGVAFVKRIADTMNWMLTTSDGRKSLMIFLMFVAVVYDKLRTLIHPS